MPLWLDQDASLRIGENRPGPKGLPSCRTPPPRPALLSHLLPSPPNGVMLATENEKPGLQGKMKAAWLWALAPPL